MEPKNIKTALICGDDELNKTLLFKLALNCAEKGSSVLYISNKPISGIPSQLRRSAVKETMKKIIFMYFETVPDLLSQCVELHNSFFVPTVILVDVLDYYCKLDSDSFNMHRAALVCASLVNAASTCANRTGKSSTLIVACKNCLDKAEYLKKIKLLSDLYFFKNICIFKNENETQEIFNRIINL